MVVALAFSGVGLNMLVAVLVYWVLIHGIFTAAFTLLAGGHPLSTATGFAVSWFTALNPFLAAGWFSAIVEAKIQKPAHGDFKKIFEAESLQERDVGDSAVQSRPCRGPCQCR
jgi:pheromone shutdown protein TraB